MNIMNYKEIARNPITVFFNFILVLSSMVTTTNISPSAHTDLNTAVVINKVLSTSLQKIFRGVRTDARVAGPRLNDTIRSECFLCAFAHKAADKRM